MTTLQFKPTISSVRLQAALSAAHLSSVRAPAAISANDSCLVTYSGSATCSETIDATTSWSRCGENAAVGGSFGARAVPVGCLLLRNRTIGTAVPSCCLVPAAPPVHVHFYRLIRESTRCVLLRDPAGAEEAHAYIYIRVFE